MRHSLLRFSLAALVLTSTHAAAVTCSAFFHPLRTVGDTATDATCTDNDIQSAIDNADPACTTDIAITREHVWNNQHLTVSNKSINFVGQADGVSCSQVIACGVFSPCPTTAVTTLNAGGSGRALTITGTSYVVVGGLTLTGGNTSGNGGGIDFEGAGALTVYSSTIVNNTAANGGGIEINGSGAGVRLTLQSETLILSNTATGSGGGIDVEGNARLFALLPQTLIGYNHAPNGYGGGVRVAGPAMADIASSGYGAGGAIFFNDAMYGGGIAAIAAVDNLPALVRLFSVDAQKPVRISQNFATHTGGAVFLKPLATGTDYAQSLLCAMDFRIDGNAAQEGAAIYADTDYFLNTPENSVVYLNTIGTEPQCYFPESATTLGAVACARGAGCNEIDQNVAQDSGGNPTPGSTILVQNTGYLESTALDLRKNSGASAVRMIDANASLQNCLVVGGTYTGPVLKFQSDGDDATSEQVRNCTFADNSIGSGNAVIASAYPLGLLDSIVAQPGVATLDYTAPANQLDVEYVLSNDLSTLPVSAGVVQGAPMFVDAPDGDYRLARTSLGLDFAPAVSGDDRDLDGLPHDQDLPTVPNGYGVRDLGAYERQLRYCGASDTFFCDEFELQ